MIDIAIIGAGPAGLSAAINIASRNKKPVVFGRPINSSWLYAAELVNNHLGMPKQTGVEMLNNFRNHAIDLGVEIKEGRILQILDMGSHFALNFENEFVEAKKVIIATGISKGKTIKGESEFLGKGVSYCATCDGMLYRGKDVVVVGETEEGIHDANFLAEICNKVYYLPYNNQIENLNLINGKIEVIENVKLTEVIGDEFVNSVLVGDKTINCSGVFFIKQTTPITSLIFNLELDDNNAIKINRLCQTNLNGIFAAGDCTGAPFQVSKAVGEGLVAGLQAVKEL